MSRSPEETYIQTYQKYLKQKGTSEAPSTYNASTKLPRSDPSQCKICTVLAKPPDLYRVLNQGLYHKYTASQDYFYTRDINSLLNRKRKSFCVRYNDDLIFDECKERLKGFFKKKDSQSLMTEIKDFYTKFKNFPRNFHPQFSSIINSNIRKHRRLEYIKVFNNPNFDESRGPGDLESPDDGRFNFMELLGSSFLQDNYKDISGVAIGGNTRSGQSTMREITANFRALYSVPVNTVNEPGTEPFSNAMYNKNYMLYSRSDSTNAEDILKQIVNEFHEGNLEKKPAMTLAEKVLQQVAANNKNLRKHENRYSPTLKQRGQGGLESSSILHGSKKSLGSSTSIMTASQLQLQKQNSQPLNTGSQRGNSNPRSTPHVDSESIMLGKLSHNPSGKFSVENLNEIVINRNKILSKLYQFRSTRSKSGGLKSTGSTATTSCKTPSGMGRRPLGINCDIQGFDSVDSKQLQTVCYTHEKSHSQSPERRLSRDKSSGALEVTIPKQKTTTEAQYYSAGIPRSASNVRGSGGIIDTKDLASPLHPTRTRSSPQKKTSGNSSVARRTPVVQNYIFDGVDNSGDSGLNNINISQNQENPNINQLPMSPNNGKFINPLRNSLGGTQQTYYLRHQSPMEDRVTPVSSVLQKVRSEARMKNLNIRALKNNNSPNRVGTSPNRMGTMSMSRRQHTMLELSQAANSFAAGQTASNGSHIAKNRSLRKSEAQLVGNKTGKRSSLIQNPVNNQEEKEKKAKKAALEISNGASGSYKDYKDLRLPSKEQTPLNFFPASATTSYQKIKSEMRKSGIGSLTTKATGKEAKFGVRK